MDGQESILRSKSKLDLVSELKKYGPLLSSDEAINQALEQCDYPYQLSFYTTIPCNAFGPEEKEEENQYDEGDNNEEEDYSQLLCSSEMDVKSLNEDAMDLETYSHNIWSSQDTQPSDVSINYLNNQSNYKLNSISTDIISVLDSSSNQDDSMLEQTSSLDSIPFLSGSLKLDPFLKSSGLETINKLIPGKMLPKELYSMQAIKDLEPRSSRSYRRKSIKRKLSLLNTVPNTVNPLCSHYMSSTIPDKNLDFEINLKKLNSPIDNDSIIFKSTLEHITEPQDHSASINFDSDSNQQNLPLLNRLLDKIINLAYCNITSLCITLSVLCIINPFLWWFTILYLYNIYQDDTSTINNNSYQGWKNWFIFSPIKNSISRSYTTPTTIPVELELLNTQNYLIIHSSTSAASLPSLHLAIKTFSYRFPDMNFHPLTSSSSFRIPFYREILLILGYLRTNPTTLTQLFSFRTGQVAVLNHQPSTSKASLSGDDHPLIQHAIKLGAEIINLPNLDYTAP